MFEFYDDMTIDEAVKFQNENYLIRNDEGEVVFNITQMNVYRKEMLDAITGGSKEQFDNILTLREPRKIYSPDGFIYTSFNGKDLVCIGAIADAENFSSSHLMYNLACIADKIGESAFAIDSDKPVTLFEYITFPFLKPHGLPAHSMRNQIATDIIFADNLTEKECLDALSFVTTAEN